MKNPFFVPSKGKQPEDFLAQETKSARNGIGGFLILGFSLARTLQLLSRTPGTAALHVHGSWLFGAGLLGFYLHGHHELHGRADVVPWEVFMVFQAVLFLVGSIERELSPSPLGRGVLTSRLPGLSPRVCGVISDTVIGVAIAGGLYLTGNPVLSSCMQVVLGWTLACHTAVLVRDELHRMRINEAKKRARHWHDQVRGRHF